MNLLTGHIEIFLSLEDQIAKIKQIARANVALSQQDLLDDNVLAQIAWKTLADNRPNTNEQFHQLFW